MMREPAVPFVLLGDKHCATLRLLLMQCVSTWWSGWKNSTDVIEVELRDDAAAAELKHVRTSGDYVLARDASGKSLVAVRASSEFMGALSGIPAMSSFAAAGEMAQQLRIEVLKSLCAAVLTRAKASDAVVDVLPPTQRVPATARGSRSVCANVSLGTTKGVVTLVLMPALVELFGLHRTAMLPQDGLSRRHAAIREECVRVEAVLGSVEVTLLDLANLAVGDVIVLDQPLGQAGHLATPDGACITKIVLGRTGAQRAVSMAR
jgi:hypothetical protein